MANPNIKSKRKPKHKNYEALLSLGKDRLVLVDALLIKGETPLNVAREIQNEWGLLKDQSEVALRMMLYRYKHERLAENLVVATPMVERPEAYAYVKELRDKFHGVEDMIDLANMQKLRLNKMLLREEQMPVLMDQVSREMNMMASMVERTIRLQMDLGLVRSSTDGAHVSDEELKKAYASSVQLSAKLKEMTYRALRVIEGDFEVTDVSNYPEELDVNNPGAVSPQAQGD